MSDASLRPIRQDLRNLCRYCEEPVRQGSAPDHAPFSQDELQMICYYANEIAKVADSQRFHEQSNPIG